MCTCGVKNKMFELKLPNIFKIQANYKHYLYKCFTIHVNIYLQLQTNIYINMSSSFFGTYRCVVSIFFPLWLDSP